MKIRIISVSGGPNELWLNTSNRVKWIFEPQKRNEKKKSIKQKILILYWFLFCSPEMKKTQPHRHSIEYTKETKGKGKCTRYTNRAATTPIPD